MDDKKLIDLYPYRVVDVEGIVFAVQESER